MFTCNNCNNEFDSIFNFIKHLSKYHNNISIFNCNFDNCNRRFSNLHSYRYHLNRHETVSNINLPILNLDNLESVNVGEGPQPVVNLPNVEYININLAVADSSDDLQSKFIDMKDRFLKMVLSVYNENSFSRKKILIYLKQITHMFKENLNILLNIFENSTADVNTKIEIKTLIQLFSISCTVQSEYLFLKKINELGYFSYPQTVIINTTTEIKTINNIPKIVNSKITIQTIDLTELFGKLFNNTNMLLDIYNHMQVLNDRNNGFISNIIQTKYWKDRIKYLDSARTLNLPLFVYCDDFEPNNPLGSRAKIKKMGGVYVTIPCFPDYLGSKLLQIFLAQIFFSKDRATFKNDRIFAPLIEQLNNLQTTGILINFKQFTSVKLIPIVVLGDNLGVNQMLGFVESFSANYFCRICKSGKLETSYQTVQNDETLRNVQNYENDILINDVKQTGIKENSIFNSLLGFHVTENYSVDIMHDILEGIAHYDIIRLLRIYLFEKNLFSLDILNKRILSFDYGILNKKNKPPQITSEMLKTDKLKYSASEMLNLIKIFNLLICDLVPESDPHWKLYLLLREIVSILNCRSINN